jgi:hypothetical protein
VNILEQQKNEETLMVLTNITLCYSATFQKTLGYNLSYCDMTPEKRNCPLIDNGSLKHVSVTTNRHAIIDELFQVVTSIRFTSSYKRETRVEAGSNTTTVALRVAGGDEKGSLESETVKYGNESHGIRTRK